MSSICYGYDSGTHSSENSEEAGFIGREVNADPNILKYTFLRAGGASIPYGPVGILAASLLIQLCL